MSTMMIDVSCPQCGRRFGWAGQWVDRPACPKCGHRPAQADLDATQAWIERDQKLCESRPHAKICREQRVLVGLGLRQAAKLLGVRPVELSDVEAGRVDLPADLGERMAVVYKGGEA